MRAPPVRPRFAECARRPRVRRLHNGSVHFSELVVFRAGVMYGMGGVACRRPDHRGNNAACGVHCVPRPRDEVPRRGDGMHQGGDVLPAGGHQVPDRADAMPDAEDGVPGNDDPVPG